MTTRALESHDAIRARVATLRRFAVETLKLHVTQEDRSFMSAGGDTWADQDIEFYVTISYKQVETLRWQAHALARRVCAWCRKQGVETGMVSVSLDDEGVRPTEYHKFCFAFANGQVALLDQAQSRAAPTEARAGLNLRIRLYVSWPGRRQDLRNCFWHHPPLVSRRWRCGIALPKDAEGDCSTMLCERRRTSRSPPSGRFRDVGALRLRGDVAAWCRDHIGPTLFVAKVATLYVTCEADELAFRLRWL